MIRVRGELDVCSAQLLRNHLAVVVECEVGDVEVDMFDVCFIDASGLRVIVETDRRLRATGGRRLRIVTPSPGVLRLLELTGLTGHFEAVRRPLYAAGLTDIGSGFR